MSRRSDWVSIVWDQVTCRKVAKTGHVVYPIVENDITDFCIVTSQGGKAQLVSQTLKGHRNSESLILFEDTWVVSKASLSVAEIHGSRDVKSEILPIAVTTCEKSRPLTTVQFYVHEKLMLGDQIVELQEFKDRYPDLSNLPNHPTI